VPECRRKTGADGDARSAGNELSELAETLLIPLAFRALEAREPNPIVRDRIAGAIVNKMGLDLSRFKRMGLDRVFTMMRAREFVRCVCDSLESHPAGVVVEIGCGLDDRLSRVDNGRIEYYAMDPPEVMALRARFFLKPASDEGYLILAEGVLPCFHAHQVMSRPAKAARLVPGTARWSAHPRRTAA
jgi:hypothetical protein